MWSFSGRGIWVWVFSLVPGNADLWEAFMVFLEKQSVIVAALNRSLPPSSSGSLVASHKVAKDQWNCAFPSPAPQVPLFRAQMLCHRTFTALSPSCSREPQQEEKGAFIRLARVADVSRSRGLKLSAFIRYLIKYFRQEKFWAGKLDHFIQLYQWV